MSEKMYNTLVLSGGGIHVTAFIGVIDKLRYELSSLRNIVGSSGGAIVALLITLGLDAGQIKQIVLNITETHRHIDLVIDTSMVFSFGLLRPTFLEELIHTLFKLLNLSTSVTFADLAKLTGKNLVVCTTNITEGKVMYLSTDTTPLTRVQHALLMSCSIPLLFPPYSHEGCLYVDSIFTKNFPIDYAKNKFAGATLGLNIVSRVKHTPDITSYVLALYNTVLCSHSTCFDETMDEHVQVYNIDCTGLDNFDPVRMNFVFSEEILEEHIVRGIRALSKHETERSP